VQGPPPSETQRRAVGDFRYSLDRLRPRQQPKWTRWQLRFLAVLSKPVPAGIAVDGLRGKNGLGQFRNVAVLSDQPAHAARSQSSAQTIDKTTKLGCIFTAAYADLFGRTGLGDHDRQPRHVEAEAGIECISQSGKPFHEQPANIIRIAQRPRRTGSDAADHAVSAEQGELDAAGAVTSPFQRELQPPRQSPGNCQNVFLARNRLGKTLLGHIRRHRQSWSQRFVLMAQGTIELTQHVRPKTCSQRRAWQIDDIADAFETDAGKPCNCRRRQA